MFCPIQKNENDDPNCASCAMYVVQKNDGWKGCAFVRMALDISKSQGL
jgi:hypothetical protein